MFYILFSKFANWSLGHTIFLYYLLLFKTLSSEDGIVSCGSLEYINGLMVNTPMTSMQMKNCNCIVSGVTEILLAALVGLMMFTAVIQQEFSLTIEVS